MQQWCADMNTKTQRLGVPQKVVNLNNKPEAEDEHGQACKQGVLQSLPRHNHGENRQVGKEDRCGEDDALGASDTAFARVVSGENREGDRDTHRGNQAAKNVDARTRERGLWGGCMNPSDRGSKPLLATILLLRSILLRPIRDRASANVLYHHISYDGQLQACSPTFAVAM